MFASLASCQPIERPASSADWVSITLNPLAYYPGGEQTTATMIVGDVDTLDARAARGAWVQLVCDSRARPSCFSFSSSNDSVATVDWRGIVVARKVGTTLLTAKYQELEASLPLTVIPPVEFESKPASPVEQRGRS